jgi:RNA polymerase sigma factor (TIGR02999 family)
MFADSIMSEDSDLDDLPRLSESASPAADFLPLLYDELRRLAGARLANEKAGQTLQPTALVHEAFLRLGGEQRFTSRNHFFAAAAEAMRRILVEAARRKGRAKRGGGLKREYPDLDDLTATDLDEQILPLHESLEQLALTEPRTAKLVDLDISLSTADRSWRYARAWLYARMAESQENAGE